MRNPATPWTPYARTPDAHREKMGPWRFVQPPGLEPLKNKYVARLLTADPDPKVPAEQHMKSIAMSAFLSGWPREHIEGILLESPVFGPRLRREPEVLADLLRDARARATPEQVDIYVEYLEADIAAARDAAQAIRWQSTEKIRVSSAATTMVLLAILTIADAAKTTTDLHLAVRAHENVRRLEVAVHHPGVVGGGDGLGGSEHGAHQHPAICRGADRSGHLREGSAAHQTHRVEGPPIRGLPDVVNRHDGGVLEPAGDGRFAGQPGRPASSGSSSLSATSRPR